MNKTLCKIQIVFIHIESSRSNNVSGLITLIKTTGLPFSTACPVLTLRLILHPVHPTLLNISYGMLKNRHSSCPIIPLTPKPSPPLGLSLTRPCPAHQTSRHHPCQARHPRLLPLSPSPLRRGLSARRDFAHCRQEPGHNKIPCLKMIE